MTYRDRIKQLSLHVPKDIVPEFNQKRQRSRTPTQAVSNFLTNREQGDWAERLILSAINKINKYFVAVQYGRSDRVVAGEEGFKEFYTSYQDELDRIGKRPDILVFDANDYQREWNFRIGNLAEDTLAEIVPHAIAGVEIRSSSFFLAKYDEHFREKTASTSKREFLSFTPKVEDMIVVYKWIQTYGVPHYYFQVFFDRVYGIAFEGILEILADPASRKKKYFLERNEKSQQKWTIHIGIKEGVEIAYKVQMPEHKSIMRELGRGRLLFHVTFKGGEAYLNAENLFALLNLPHGE